MKEAFCPNTDVTLYMCGRIANARQTSGLCLFLARAFLSLFVCLCVCVSVFRLALPPQQQPVVQREGWRYDESSGFVSIDFKSAPSTDELALTDEHLQQLVDYAVHLSRT